MSATYRFRSVLILVSGLVLSTTGMLHAAETAKPNIIVVLFDDMGWGEPPSYDSESKLRTPHLDELARQGMRFTDAHSASAVCTPTRYGLLTGRYPARIGQFGVLQSWSSPLIPPERPTIASLLKGEGYETACIGKWHLGLDWDVADQQGTPPVDAEFHNGPNALGFDYFCGFTHAGGISTILEQNRVVEQVSPKENQPLMLRKATEWLRQRDTDTPFFLYFPMCPPHYPVAPTEEFLGRSGGIDVAGKNLKGPHDPEHYPDWLYQGDAMLGEIMRVLEERKLSENTILIATSDNGAEHRVYPPLRDSKRSIYEGGHRVPFVIRWPGHASPGCVSNHTICLNDLLATVAEVTGVSLPANAGEDSFSFLSELSGKQQQPRRESMIHQSMGGDLALRRGPWKLIVFKDGRRELYHLESDVSETHDLAGQKPEVVRELTALLKDQIQNGRSTPGPPQPNDFDLKLPDMTSATKKNPTPRIVAHRGLTQLAPENTLAAFCASIERQIGFEFDVQRTQDGTLVCIHDDDVTRTTDGQGNVTELTYDELRQLDAGSWFDEKFAGEKIPSIEEVLRLLAESPQAEVLLAVDLKSEDVGEEVARMAVKLGVEEKLLFIGSAISNPDIRAALTKVSPQVHTAALANNPEEFAAALSMPDADWVYLRFLPTREQMDAVHRADKRAFIAGATVSSHLPDNWRTASEAGIDAILTDFPLELQGQLKSTD
ncbi:MAG: hypothetical protein CMJ46_07365 [Planctomyces sp.]|nr:hypothetical protein [Planctomyces sp.]